MRRGTPIFLRACAGALLLVAGGARGGAAGEPVPPLLREAASQTRAGEEAYLTGRAAAAVGPLRAAVQLHLAAGDFAGAARALLNLALAQRAAGDAAGAAATAARLGEITPAAQQEAAEVGGSESDPAELPAAATWLAALVALDRGDAAATETLLGAVGGRFVAMSPWPGRLENLRAEAALAQGRLPEAVGHARAGAGASAAARDRAEEARGWRLAGAAQVRLGQWTEARAALLGALRLEESLGGGARMAGDLEQLALVAGKLGDQAGAELYARRARAIRAAR